MFGHFKVLKFSTNSKLFLKASSDIRQILKSKFVNSSFGAGGILRRLRKHPERRAIVAGVPSADFADGSAPAASSRSAARAWPWSGTRGSGKGDGDCK